MMKKKLLSLALAGMMVLGLAACGGNGGDTSSDASTDSSTDSSAAAPTGAAFKLGGTGPLTGAAAIYGESKRSTPRAATSSSTCGMRTTCTTPRRP